MLFKIRKKIIRGSSLPVRIKWVLDPRPNGRSKCLLKSDEKPAAAYTVKHTIFVSIQGQREQTRTSVLQYWKFRIPITAYCHYSLIFRRAFSLYSIHSTAYCTIWIFYLAKNGLVGSPQKNLPSMRQLSINIDYCSQILSPWPGDIVNSGMGLYRPASRYGNPMPESTISPVRN